MEKSIKIKRENGIRLSLVILISLFIHVIIFLGILMPVFDDFFDFLRLKQLAEKSSSGRDIIVNINEDDKRIINRSTLLSEKDSSAKGYITRRKGDQWLNNSRDFSLQKGSKTTGRFFEKSLSQRNKTGILLTDNTELIVQIMKQESGNFTGEDGDSEITKIPDKYSFSRENAIFYSNDGTFSFNTAKFKPFRYFKEMKDKIANHWFPPLLANAIISGYDPVTGSYTPGRVRIMAIPNQIVKLYFTMNRNGDVLDVGIVDSMGNKPLDSSCLDSIKDSKNFGKVPDEIPGKEILIRFVFIYIVE